jgi:hypothetical protein
VLALAGSFAASAFALVRYALKENRSVSDRFTSFLEGALKRQEDSNRSFQGALENLVENVRDNSALLIRVLEKLG